MRTWILVSALIGQALAQGTAYSQCGGQGWTGATTCVSGYTCVYSNQWYSQCLPGSATSSTVASHATSTSTSTADSRTTSTSTSTSAAATTTDACTGGFKWFGVDESGAEFGQTNIPGVYGTDFIFPATSTIDTLFSQGFNIFRVPFLMERMIPTSLTNTPNAAYLANYTATINYMTSKGAYAIIDPHNYGRYYGSIITDVTGFQTFWSTLAATFKSNTKVIFDTNNEYHDMDQTLVLNLNQAAIDGIRAAGATTQYIFVEGNSYSAAYTWNTTNTNLAALTDPQDLIVYEMHQYLDSDNSGTSDVCVSSTIGYERVVGATEWLRENGKLGIIGEFAGGANSQCLAAVTGMLDQMQANSDVWLGALWWGGGPWWGSYIFSFEPPSGIGYTYYDTTLEEYTP